MLLLLRQIFECIKLDVAYPTDSGSHSVGSTGVLLTLN